VRHVGQSSGGHNHRASGGTLITQVFVDGDPLVSTDVVFTGNQSELRRRHAQARFCRQRGGASQPPTGHRTGALSTA
jgi:hypothetical protein